MHNYLFKGQSRTIVCRKNVHVWSIAETGTLSCGTPGLLGFSVCIIYRSYCMFRTFVILPLCGVTDFPLCDRFGRAWVQDDREERTPSLDYC